MLLAVTGLLMLAACMDENGPPGSETREETISVNEAKAFFEEQMMRMRETTGGNELHGFATDFTPQWKDAVINGRDSMVSVDVPVEADFLFRAVILANNTAETKAFLTYLRQKLIVVKNLRTGMLRL